MSEKWKVQHRLLVQLCGDLYSFSFFLIHLSIYLWCWGRYTKLWSVKEYKISTLVSFISFFWLFKVVEPFRSSTRLSIKTLSFSLIFFAFVITDSSEKKKNSSFTFLRLSRPIFLFLCSGKKVYFFYVFFSFFFFFSHQDDLHNEQQCPQSTLVLVVTPKKKKKKRKRVHKFFFS